MDNYIEKIGFNLHYMTAHQIYITLLKFFAKLSSKKAAYSPYITNVKRGRVRKHRRVLTKMQFAAISCPD